VNQEGMACLSATHVHGPHQDFTLFPSFPLITIPVKNNKHVLSLPIKHGREDDEVDESTPRKKARLED